MRNINFRTALEQFPEAKRGESRAFLNSFRSRESLGKHQIDLKISGTASWNTRDARKPAELRNSFLKHNRFWRQLGSKSFLKHLIQFNNRTELNIVAFWNAQKGHENSPENSTSNLKMYGQYCMYAITEMVARSWNDFTFLHDRVPKMLRTRERKARNACPSLRNNAYKWTGSWITFQKFKAPPGTEELSHEIPTLRSKCRRHSLLPVWKDGSRSNIYQGENCCILLTNDILQTYPKL